MGQIKKDRFNFPNLWLTAVVILFIVIGTVGCSGEKEEKPATKPVDSQNQKQDNTEKENSANNDEESKNEKVNNITKEQFVQIKDGMTYEEVVDLIGIEGELLSETGAAGDQHHTAMYQWYGDGSFGANVNMTFQGGKLINKTQFGLGEGNSGVKITKEMFDQIQNGMTYEEIVEIIGGEGELLSETGEKGTQFYTVMYSYQGSGLGANATFMFQANKLENKAQMGLD